MKRLMLVFAALLAIAGTSYATAAITTVSATTINACQGTATGLLRVAATCTKYETPISWNTVGPAGPTGAKGDTGAAGAAGAAGTNVAIESVSASAPCVTGGVKMTAGGTIAFVCNGAKGDTGIAGATGISGQTGPAGPKGDTGAVGSAGPVGAMGPAGPKGDVGPAADVSNLVNGKGTLLTGQGSRAMRPDCCLAGVDTPLIDLGTLGNLGMNDCAFFGSSNQVEYVNTSGGDVRVTSNFVADRWSNRIVPNGSAVSLTTGANNNDNNTSVFQIMSPTRFATVTLSTYFEQPTCFAVALAIVSP